MTTISIEVDDAAAKTFASAPKEEREKLQLLLDLRLRELTRLERRPLCEILDEIGFHAKAQGLDEELLKSIINEE